MFGVRPAIDIHLDLIVHHANHAAQRRIQRAHHGHVRPVAAAATAVDIGSAFGRMPSGAQQFVSYRFVDIDSPRMRRAFFPG